jgi:excisionase family DNA binding protein
VRSATFDAIDSADADELLTTGEAAKLLNSSRQHVVDLCDRGDLPFTTVHTHRRVQRRDVDAIRTRTNRLTRDQRRSLWLAYAVAAKIVEDPEHARSVAHEGLARMSAAARGQAKQWLAEWDRLLDRPVEDLLDTLTSRSPKSRELRQNSPFAGLLTPAERERVLTSWQANERSRSS